MKIITAIFLMITLSFSSFAQMRKAEERRARARKLALYERKKRIIEGAIWNLEIFYLNARMGKEMANFIKNKFSINGYDSTLNVDEFTYALTKDLRGISNDKHIVVCSSHWKHSSSKNIKSVKYRSIFGVRRKWRNLKRRIAYKKTLKYAWEDNFTYGDIKILPGNIGYIEFFDFSTNYSTKEAGKKGIKFVSILKYLSGTNALVIDLRNNLGGSLNMNTKVISYFITEKYLETVRYEIRYDSLYKSHFKKNDTTIYKKVFSSGRQLKKYKEKPIFILTSKHTFSAAENLTYYFKKTERGIIIGETTGGGANGHFGGFCNEDYYIIVPRVYIYDEYNKNFNWEGIGIEPDVKIESKDALKIALDSARIYMGKDSLKKEEAYYKKIKIAKQLNYSREFIDSLHKYCGNYGPLKISSDSLDLYINYDLFPPQLLIPKGKNHFTSKIFPSIKFLRNKNDEIIQVLIHWKDGYIERYKKEQLSD